jgi:hypothetical protein
VDVPDIFSAPTRILRPRLAPKPGPSLLHRQLRSLNWNNAGGFLCEPLGLAALVRKGLSLQASDSHPGETVYPARREKSG